MFISMRVKQVIYLLRSWLDKKLLEIFQQTKQRKYLFEEFYDLLGDYGFLPLTLSVFKSRFIRLLPFCGFAKSSPTIGNQQLFKTMTIEKVYYFSTVVKSLPPVLHGGAFDYLVPCGHT